MSKLFKIALPLACAAIFAFVGCNSKPVDQKPGAGGPKDSSSDGKKTSADEGEAANIAANLASLSTEDRTLAEKQKVCPVSSGLLGAMGAPIKVDVNGKTVFVCCPDCEKPLKDDPDKYLAKLRM